MSGVLGITWYLEKVCIKYGGWALPVWFLSILAPYSDYMGWKLLVAIDFQGVSVADPAVL